jgi:serine/threonine protein kinase
MTVQLTVDSPNDARADSGRERQLLEAAVQGQYQIVRELGRGGMGVVFLARDVALHRAVAIKVLKHELVHSEDARERFRREARLTARLSHPGIVPVHTFGEQGELVYIVMKYIHGESLAERLRHEHKLSAKETTRILRDLSAALDHAHVEGMIHRDLKAENVLIEKTSGRAFLTDFGVALVRDSSPSEWERSHAFGTPHYMSPEQAAGEYNLDGRSDLYSLGVLGYQMLSGRLPFEGTNFGSLASQHVARAHPDLGQLAGDAPRPLVDAIERCLAKAPDDRFKNGEEFREALLGVPTPEGWGSLAASLIGSKGLFKMVAGLAGVAVISSADKASQFSEFVPGPQDSQSTRAVTRP